MDYQRPQPTVYRNNLTASMSDAAPIPLARPDIGPREEALFFRGYGATAIDPLALAYYRYAWAVGDIGATKTLIERWNGTAWKVS